MQSKITYKNFKKELWKQLSKYIQVDLHFKYVEFSVCRQIRQILFDLSTIVDKFDKLSALDVSL